jgi:Zn-dependent protease with chaperone function
MLNRMRRALVLLLGLLELFAAGCATSAPQRATPREATAEERRAIASLLVPLLRTSGMWSGPVDGCAAALAVLPSPAINLGVGPHPQCKFALVVTETALNTLPPEELQAALAHEIGHVQLGHFAARRERRAEEKKTREEINERGSALAAIPLIGPLLAVGVMGTQIASDTALEGQYRAYDREDELAADRFALDLLERVVGRADGCRATMAILDHLRRARSTRVFSAWLSTHPSPGDRLKAVSELCPS